MHDFLQSDEVSRFTRAPVSEIKCMIADLKTTVNEDNIVHKKDIGIQRSENSLRESQRITFYQQSSLVPPPLKRASIPKLEFNIDYFMTLTDKMKPKKKVTDFKYLTSQKSKAKVYVKINNGTTKNLFKTYADLNTLTHLMDKS
jgi:hypothetical protein